MNKLKAESIHTHTHTQIQTHTHMRACIPDQIEQEEANDRLVNIITIVLRICYIHMLRISTPI